MFYMLNSSPKKQFAKQSFGGAKVTFFFKYILFLGNVWDTLSNAPQKVEICWSHFFGGLKNHYCDHYLQCLVGTPERNGIHDMCTYISLDAGFWLGKK